MVILSGVTLAKLRFSLAVSGIFFDWAVLEGVCTWDDPISRGVRELDRDDPLGQCYELSCPTQTSFMYIPNFVFKPPGFLAGREDTWGVL